MASSAKRQAWQAPRIDDAPEHARKAGGTLYLELHVIVTLEDGEVAMGPRLHDGARPGADPGELPAVKERVVNGHPTVGEKGHAEVCPDGCPLIAR